jgi:hypothetical protein
MALSCVVSEVVNAPPEVVFAAASDFAGAPQRIKGIKKMEMLTDGPLGVGTKFRETRVMFGKEATETMEVVEFQPGRSYTLRAHNCGCEYKTTVSVQPGADGRTSQVRFDFGATPLSLGAKVMGALMGWIMKGACVKAIRQDLNDIKTHVETIARA